MTEALSVLLIDEQDDNAGAISRELEAGGYAVALDRIATLEQFDAALMRQIPGVILARPQLADFDAVVALEILRTRGIFVPFLLVFAAGELDAALAAVRAGAHDGVPLAHLDRLLPAVGRAQRRAAAHRALREAETARAAQTAVDSAVTDLALALIAPISVDDVSARVLSHARHLTDSQSGFAAYVDPANGRLVFSSLTPDLAGECAIWDKGAAPERFSGPCGWVAERRRPLLSNDLVADTGVLGLGAGQTRIRRFLGVPALIGARLVGEVAVANAERDYDERDVVALERLAALFALAVDREQAGAALRRAKDHAEMLAEASDVLSASLDYETTLGNLAQLVVPRLADWCMVSMVAHGGLPHHVAIAHADPGQAVLAREIRKWYMPRADAPHGIAAVSRSGRAELWPEVDRDWLARVARDDEALALLTRARLRSLASVPLPVRGQVLGVVTFATAESGRRYGPADLELFEELAHRAAYAIDNARLYREAQTAVRARDEFFSLVSHDLRGPLAGIKGNAQLLRRRIARKGSLTAESAQEVLARIDRAATGMAAQIDELLDVARMRLGRPLDLDRQPVDLVALARRAAEEQQAASGRHRIEVDASPNSLVGQWDGVRLERLLTNLVGNAVKYSPDGGTITVALREEETGGSAWAVLAVRDRGLGIPAADLESIFEPFQRAANAAAHAGGTGLGLTSARLIAEQHGGTITAQSIEGEGSTFTVRLPL